MDEKASIPLTAQLTYTSFESAESGGWQVKELVGDLSEQELKALLARIPTRLPTPDASRFVTAEEVSGWPRRLTYLSIGDGDKTEAILMHSVSAGQDRSGRAGNVFTHCGVVGQSTARPVEAWRSPSWLTPFGADEVQHSSLQATEITGADIGPAVSDFLAQGDVWRPAVLAVVLDAVHAALMGTGPCVALLVGDTDEAANWVKAVSVCMASRTASRFHFSTLETPASHESWAAAGFHLACLVGGADELGRTENLVVIDAADAGTLGLLGSEPHLTARGDQVQATLWSSLMFEQVAGVQDLSEHLAELAALERAVPGEDAGDPAWWMSMRAAGKQTELRAEVDELLARASPSGVEDDAALSDLVQGALLTALGRVTSERWARLQELEASAATRHIRQLASAAYMESALADLDFLAKAPEVIPATRPPSSASATTVERIRELPAAIAGRDHTDHIVVVTRYLDLVHFARWHEVPAIATTTELLAEGELAPALLDVGALRAAWDFSPPKFSTTLALFREVAFGLAQVGSLPRPLLRRLGLLTGDFESRDFRDSKGFLTDLGLQVAMARLDAEKRGVTGLPDVGFWAVFAASQLARKAGDGASVAAEQVSEVVLHPENCDVLVKLFGGAVPDVVVRRSLLNGEPGSAGLAELVRSAKKMPSREAMSLATEMEPLVHGEWNRPHQLAYVRAIIKALTSQSRRLGIPLKPLYASTLPVLATCALHASPDPQYAAEVDQALPPTTVPDEIISKGVGLFLGGGYPGSSSWLEDCLPYVVKQELLSPDANRRALLSMRFGHSLSIIERLIALACIQGAMTSESLEGAVAQWVTKLRVVDERVARELEKSAMSWFKRAGVTQGGGLSSLFSKGRGGRS